MFSHQLFYQQIPSKDQSKLTFLKATKTNSMFQSQFCEQFVVFQPKLEDSHVSQLYVVGAQSEPDSYRISARKEDQ